jgi:hypothetical protein
VCDRHQFFLEFDKAFTVQLIKKFEASPSHPLSEDVAPRRSGAYVLYRKGRSCMRERPSLSPARPRMH